MIVEMYDVNIIKYLGGKESLFEVMTENFPI